jgi:hypothetical protein
MSDDKDSTQDKVQRYREIVLQYEALDEAIDALIMAAEGKPENLSPDGFQRYRDLAHQRDELQNEMRWLEQQLLDDDAQGGKKS